MELKSDVHCYLTYHAYPHMRCTARNAYAQNCWLLYHFSTKTYTCISNVPVTTGGTVCSLPLVYLNLIQSCPDQMELTSYVHCYPTCHAYPHIRCAVYARHCWLMYHIKSKSYIKYPRNHRRHSVMFASGVPKPNTVM